MRQVLAFFFISAFRIIAAAFINDDFGDLEIGKPFNVSWDASTPGPVKLSLLSNSDPTRPNVLDITSIAIIGSGNSFQWEPASSLETNLAYVMRLIDGAGDEQLSKSFKLVKRLEISSSASSSSSSTSTTIASNTNPPAPLVTSTSAQITPPASPSEPQSASSSHTSSPAPKSTGSANVRIAVSMTIVTLLILIVVALIFYEHGKRVTARNRDSESDLHSRFGQAGPGDGSDGLQLFEGFQPKKANFVSVACASCQGCVNDDSGQAVEEDVGLGIVAHARRQKLKSMQSVYELG